MERDMAKLCRDDCAGARERSPKPGHAWWKFCVVHVELLVGMMRILMRILGFPSQPNPFAKGWRYGYRYVAVYVYASIIIYCQ